MRIYSRTQIQAISVKSDKTQSRRATARENNVDDRTSPVRDHYEDPKTNVGSIEAAPLPVTERELETTDTRGGSLPDVDVKTELPRAPPVPVVVRTRRQRELEQRLRDVVGSPVEESLPPSPPPSEGALMLTRPSTGYSTVNEEEESIIPPVPTQEQVLALEIPFVRPRRPWYRVANLGILDRVVEWWFRDRVPGAVERMADEALHIIDDEIALEIRGQDLDAPTADGVDINPILRSRRKRYAAKIARMCRVAIPGVEENTKANQLVAHQWLMKKMEADHVRHAHMSSVLAYAKLYILVDTADQIEAKQLAGTIAFSNRYDEGLRHYHSRGESTIFDPFGRRYAIPAPRRA